MTGSLLNWFADWIKIKLLLSLAPGAPPTAKVFHVPLEIVGLNDAFPTAISIVPDYYSKTFLANITT